MRGRDFDAVRELEELLRPSMPRGHTEAYARVLDVLDEIGTDGFVGGRRVWTRTGVNGIWVYMDGPIRCAIQVLGQESDDAPGEAASVTLLATTFTEGHAELVIWLGDFINVAGRRLNEGEIVEWA